MGGPRTTPADQASGPHAVGKGDSRPAPTKLLGRVVGALKTMSARQINVLRGMPGVPFWQRDFYERIVRDEAALCRIREYIRCNPQRWR